MRGVGISRLELNDDIPVALLDEVVNVFDLIGLEHEVNCTRPRLSFLNQVSRFQELRGEEQSSIALGDLSTESTLQEIRESADLFLVSILDERNSVNQACENLRQHAENSAMIAWGRFADQVAIEFQQQSRDEEHSTRNFLITLDSFYDRANLLKINQPLSRTMLLRSLDSLESTLLRKTMRNGHVFRLAIELLSPLRPRPENLTRRTSTTITDGRSTISLPTSNYSTESCPISIMDLAKAFLASVDQNASTSPQYIFALVVGPQGSGKSYACGEIEELAYSRDDVSVFRPRVPFDFLGCTVGEAEDRLLALFEAASHEGQSSIILLDDVDEILFSGASEGKDSSDATSPPSHLHARLQSTLMCLMDSMTRFSPGMLLVCTSKSNFVGSFSRFDHVFNLEQPDHEQRKNFVASALGIRDTDSFEPKISSVVEALMGKSYVQLSQICSEATRDLAYQQNDSALSSTRVLDALESSIHQRIPQSLRSGILGDLIDMRVYSGEDLSARRRRGSLSFELELYGFDVQNAWKEIETNVVIPLCRRDEISRMLNHNQVSKGSDKILCGGILLHGQPGTGKTSLSFEAARYAASLLPSVILIDVGCTSLIHKEVGGSEQAVRNLFASARQAAPCIILLEGIENIAATRGSDSTTEGSLDRVLSTLLVELDGVEDHQPLHGGIAVIGTTHNDQWIDSALKRSGRLSKSVLLGLPDEQARRQIIDNELVPLLKGGNNKQMNDERMTTGDDISARLVRETKGMSGAALVATCRYLWIMVTQEARVLDEDTIGECLRTQRGG